MSLGCTQPTSLLVGCLCSSAVSSSDLRGVLEPLDMPKLTTVILSVTLVWPHPASHVNTRAVKKALLVLWDLHGFNVDLG